MDRYSRRSFVRLGGAIALAAPLVAASTGCNLVAMGLYLVQGMNQPAKFDGLRGKRVAVVCRPISTLQYRNSTVHRELAKHVCVLLEKNVRKIKLIDQREIAEWTDENNWEDYAEIGKALGADMVLGLDLDDFSLYQGQTLYQGKASITVTVFDLKKDMKIPVFEESLPQTLYPPNSAIHAGDRPEAQFRRQFVGALAEQIGRYFYEHDPTVDFSSDSAAVK